MSKSLLRPAAAALILAVLLVVPGVRAQDDAALAEREEAVRLINENKYLDALPILERIILYFPDDAELWAQFGIAIMANSVVLETPEERKAEQERGLKALKRAEQLGTDNDRALDLLEQFENADGQDNFVSDDPEVEKALREGESFFGRGDYENALKAYERAHKLDPKNYEAVLFIGDCFYAQKKYAESEPWFAKAAELDPDREMAYRFWGDALLFQEKYKEAKGKFIEAVVADPYGRMGWSSLNGWAETAEKEFSFYPVIPPGNEVGGEIEIKPSEFRKDDGTEHWAEYDKTLKALSAKAAAGERLPRFRDDVEAWRAVAAAFRKDLKAGKIKYPDYGLVNLVRIDDEGLLESYVLLIRPHDHYGDDYVEYRNANRAKIRTFIEKYIVPE